MNLAALQPLACTSALPRVSTTEAPARGTTLAGSLAPRLYQAEDKISEFTRPLAPPGRRALAAAGAHTDLSLIPGSSSQSNSPLVVGACDSPESGCANQCKTWSKGSCCGPTGACCASATSRPKQASHTCNGSAEVFVCAEWGLSFDNRTFKPTSRRAARRPATD
jgi:hypothetical protein